MVSFFQIISQDQDLCSNPMEHDDIFTISPLKSHNSACSVAVGHEDTSLSEESHSSAEDSSSQLSDDSDDNSEDNLSSDLECITAHFLEEEPHEEPFQAEEPLQPNARRPPDYDDDDDPDDPDGPGEGEDDDSDHSSDRDEEDPANVTHDNLNVEVQLHENLTKGEVIALQLGTAVRHQKTFVSMIDSFRNLNLLFGPRTFPECKTSLWNIIHLNRVGMVCHVYCKRRTCGRYLGRKDRLGEVVVCQCGMEVNISKAGFFVTLNLRRQLKIFLSLPGIWEKLQYPRTRQKMSPTAIEDIYDGEFYRFLKQEGGPLFSLYNFSLVFNTDGVNPTKRGSLKMWPVYVRMNELPPEMRQKFTFVAAVYIDHVDPNFQSFLKPVVRQLNDLSTRGITWKPDGVNEVTSKFVPLCHCVDSPARFGILQMAHWNSDFGCTYCTHKGVQDGGNQRYSVLDVNDLPAIADRTHRGMVQNMLTAQQMLNDGRRNEIPYLGHKGTTPMLLLENHDLREGQAVDDLHQDHEGCAADLTELLVTLAPRVIPNMATAELLRRIDERLLHIKTPSRIARKPRSILHRSKFNGSEWRNWLFFYAVPCLTGLIHPDYVELMALLSHGCYLLSQDVIEQRDINEADRVLRRYATSFEEKFQRHRLKFNMHVTTSHKVHCVRKLGSPFAYTTYNFESLNSKMAKNVTSPKGAVIQVLTRSLLNLTVNIAQYDERLSEAVRERLKTILSKERLKRVREVGLNQYVVGRGTGRVPSAQEAEVLVREGFNGVENYVEYKGVLIGNTRYKSVAGQDPSIRSVDTCVYTFQNTLCQILKVIVFRDHDGHERSGMFVMEHDVANVHPVARHLSLLRDAAADLLHFVHLNQVRCPFVKMDVDGVVYTACVPNCYEID